MLHRAAFAGIVAAALALMGAGHNSSQVAAAPAAEELPHLQYARQAVFAIPFQIDPPAPGQQPPAAVELHVSTDGGQTWQKQAQAAPLERRFNFHAQRDGEYWFCVRTTDALGRLYPPGPLRPELRVIVDTLAPRLELNATRGEAGELIVEWRILDRNLDPESLIIETQVDGRGGPWQSLALDRSSLDAERRVQSGTVAWWDEGDAPLVVRARVADRAGNPAVTQAQVAPLPESLAARRAEARAARHAQRPEMNEDVAPWPYDARRRGPAQPWAPDVSSSAPLGQPPAEELPAPPASSRPPTTSPPPTGSPPDGRPAETNYRGPGGGPVDRGGTDPYSAAFDEAGFDGADEAPAAGGRPFADGAPITSGAPVGPGDADNSAAWPEFPAAAPYRAFPQPRDVPGDVRSRGSDAPPGSTTAPAHALTDLPLRMVASRRFELEYEVDSVGPAGIRRVELWGTRDGGHTWAVHATDDDLQSPILVVVEGEGTYGFRIVVESGYGVASPTPRPGDLPEIWVGVDLTEPVARLTNVEAQRDQHSDLLVIEWEASDTRLAARPIALAFRETPGGPLSPIASGLEHTGRYVWRLDQRLPDRLYLRLEVRDEAGNVAIVEPDEPVLLERARPQGHIRDVRPVRSSERPRPQPRQ